MQATQADPVRRNGRRSRRISHDKIFKTLFQNFLQDFVDMLERDVGRLLDFATVQYLSGEAFAELKKDGHLNLDLVASLTRRDTGAPALIHAEIEARFRGTMASRMWKYFTHLCAANQGAVVLPVVVFLKGGPPGLHEQETTSTLGSFTPVTFRYLSLGLSGCLAEEWLQKPQILVAALAACMRSKIWDPVEHKLQCMRRVLNEKDPARQYLLTQVIENYLELTDEENERYQAAFAKETKTMVPFPLTFEEALEEKEARGEARGIAVGEARGEARGESRGLRESILLLVQSRFGTTPANLSERLAAISDRARLREILERALQVRSLDQLDTVLS